MKSQYITILSCLVFFYSCNSIDKNRKDDRFKNVDLAKYEDVNHISTVDSTKALTLDILDLFPQGGFNILSLDKIIEYIEFIPLETGEEFLIGTVDKMLLYNEQIIILDNIGKSIYLFSGDGKFLKRIGRLGKGPGEYINPTDIALKGDILYIHDDSQQTILRYSLLDGAHIGSTKTTLRFNDFFVMDENNFWINADLRPNYHLGEIGLNKLFLCDSLFYPKISYFSYRSEEEAARAYARSSFYTYGEDLFYNPHYSDYIYQITKEKIEPKYFFNFGNRSLSKEYMALKLSEDNYKKYENSESNFLFINDKIHETNNLLVTTIRTNSLNIGTYYFKKSNKLFGSAFYETEGESKIANARFLALLEKENSDIFFKTLDAFDYVKIIGAFKDKFSEKINIQDNRIKAIREDDNPILLKMTFKNDIN